MQFPRRALCIHTQVLCSRPLNMIAGEASNRFHGIVLIGFWLFITDEQHTQVHCFSFSQLTQPTTSLSPRLTQPSQV
jgi:hypothetical protein